MSGALEGALGEAVGPAHVLSDPDLLASYETDWTRRFSGRARCVVRPGTTAEVAAAVLACGRHGARLVIQGGNTGLVGGGVPVDGEVVLSTTRLSRLGEVDQVSGQVTVGAGVPLARLQEHVRAHGYDVGVDLAARDSATVGGLVATNAGGERVLRYGATRAQVAGIEAVLPDASIVSRLAGLPKDNTGYDLMGLLAGSEGTLAVITSVRVRLVPLLPARTVALLGVDGAAGALRVLAGLKERLPVLEAAEIFLPDGLALVLAATGLGPPLPQAHPAYLLVECADRVDPTDRMVEALGEVDAETGAVRDAAVATDAGSRHKLWRYREAHTEAISAVGIPVKLDVAVPLADLAEMIERLPAAVAGVAPGARTVIFGHLNEGNLHVNVLGAGEREHEVTDTVLRLVAGSGGSISAEHGVGRAKAAWLPIARTEPELRAMRAIKRSFDPAGMFNPGVLEPPRGAF